MINQKQAYQKIVACLCLILAICSKVLAQTPGTFQVEGKLAGLGNQMVYLTAEYNNKKYGDSVNAKDDVFAFNIKTPGVLFFVLRSGKNGALTFFPDVNEKIKVSGTVDNLSKATITGSKNQKIWGEWSSAWAGIASTAGILYRQLDSIEKAAGKDGDRSAVNLGFSKLEQRLIDSVESFVKKYPSAPVTPFIIVDRFINYPNLEKARSSYAALSVEGKKTLYGKELAEALRIAAKTGIGVQPDFTLPDKDGKQVKLSALRGKVILVDFWASWCVPCRKENPNLTKAYAKYHAQGFEILGVSLDNNKAAWLAAIAADQLPWLHVSDLKGWKSELIGEYGIRSIPTSFLIDEKGKIIAKDLRGDALENKLSTLFQ